MNEQNPPQGGSVIARATSEQVCKCHCHDTLVAFPMPPVSITADLTTCEHCRPFYQQQHEHPIQYIDNGYSLREQPACQHQFFKTADVQPAPDGYVEAGGGLEVATYPPHTGVQVMCAQCGQQRQLWGIGEMLIWRNEQWEVKDLNVID